MAGVDPWGPYQLPEMVEMARARNDLLWAHDVALINLLANSFAKSPVPADKFKPLKGLDDVG